MKRHREAEQQRQIELDHKDVVMVVYSDQGPERNPEAMIILVMIPGMDPEVDVEVTLMKKKEKRFFFPYTFACSRYLINNED